MQTLKDILENPWAKPSTKVRAAKVILDVSLKLVGVAEDDDENRIAPPAPPPAFDLSKLSPEEFEQLRALRKNKKMRVA